MILNFFLVPRNMRNPTLKRTSLNYLKGMFILDFIACIVSNILLVTPATREASFSVKLIRVTRLDYIRFCYRGIID